MRVRRIFAVAVVLIFFPFFFLRAEGASISDQDLLLYAIQERLFFVSLQIRTAFGSPLLRGTRGEDVRQFQEFISKDPSLYPEGLITGYFGPLTERAVHRFQVRHGFLPTGVLDAKTLDAVLAGQDAAGGIFSSVQPIIDGAAPLLEPKATEGEPPSASTSSGSPSPLVSSGSPTFSSGSSGGGGFSSPSSPPVAPSLETVLDMTVSTTSDALSSSSDVIAATSSSEKTASFSESEGVENEEGVSLQVPKTLKAIGKEIQEVVKEAKGETEEIGKEIKEMVKEVKEEAREGKKEAEKELKGKKPEEASSGLRLHVASFLTLFSEALWKIDRFFR